MQSDVDQVRGDLVEHRPGARRVGHHHADPVRAQHLAELRGPERLVPHLEHVPQRLVDRSGRVGALLEPGGLVTVPGQLGGVRRTPGQRVEEVREALRVEGRLRRQLPQHRTEAGTQRQHAAGEEVGQRDLRVREPLHVRDEPGTLDREHEVVRHRVRPGAPARRSLQRVERPVDLDRRQPAGGVLELTALWQAGRVEHAPPTGVAPARDADPDHGALGLRPPAPRP